VASYHYIRVLAAGLFVGYFGIQYRQTSWTAVYFATLQASSLSFLALLAQKVQILTPEALQLFSEKSKAVIPKEYVMLQNLTVVCVCVCVCLPACLPACVCGIFPRNFKDFQKTKSLPQKFSRTSTCMLGVHADTVTAHTCAPTGRAVL
jgi:hypothetical protein